MVKCEILPCFFSDHDSVDLVFDVENVFSHGPGVWKLNLELLQDSDFCEKIVQMISKLVDYQRCFPSLHEWWDFSKSSFKDIAQVFSKNKQTRLNRDRVNATNLLIKAKRDLVAGDESAKLRIEHLENDLLAISRAQNEAVKICSRAQWLEDGEKPTKYFFSLESTRAEKNLIRVIYNSEGTEVVTQPDIEAAHCDFYRKLYSCDPVDLKIQQDLLSKVQISLSDQDSGLYENVLSADEISHAVRGLSKGKTPGSEGLPVEFYVKFWDQLCPILLQIYQFSFDQGFLSTSMQGSVTRLIFKKDDPENLKNWRPISLLNVDYKILSKALTNRLSKVLTSIVGEDQTCSVPNRTIFDNLTLFRDTLNYIDLTNETGILVSLDQEKAFDRVDRSFLSNVLRRFGFGSVFERWISVLYHDAAMRILVNGFLTDQIPLERGVRQGNPLSPLLYILCAEVLAFNIRSETTIRGFLLPGAQGQQFKMRQYADDSMCFVKDLYSLSVLFSILKRYELGTGAKLNYSKTEAMWLGAWRSCLDKPLGLTWVVKMKILGVWYTNGLANLQDGDDASVSCSARQDDSVISNTPSGVDSPSSQSFPPSSQNVRSVESSGPGYAALVRGPNPDLVVYVPDEENELPTRPLTVYFNPRSSVPAAEVFTALQAANVDSNNISCIQRQSSGEIVLTFRNAQAKDQFLTHNVLEIRGRPFALQDVDRPLTYVQIFDAPHEMPDETIIQRLSKYCEVFHHRRGYFREDGWTHVQDGVRHFRVRIKQHIPNYIRFGKILIHIRYDGQPRTCRHCNQTGHYVNACHSIICYNCKNLGHLASDCPHAVLCNICKQPDHRAIHCPFSWSRQVVNEDPEASEAEEVSRDEPVPCEGTPEPSEQPGDQEMEQSTPEEYLSASDESTPNTTMELFPSDESLVDQSSVSAPKPQRSRSHSVRRPAQLSPTVIPSRTPTTPVLVTTKSREDSPDDAMNVEPPDKPNKRKSLEKQRTNKHKKHK